MDLTVFKLRNGGSWRAGKLAALACFLATGGLLMTALINQNRLTADLIGTSKYLF
ncbi:MAG: hypothetical protein R3D57_01625 [Hyphomicrobiaceae bacterium]